MKLRKILQDDKIKADGLYVTVYSWGLVSIGAGGHDHYFVENPAIYTTYKLFGFIFPPKTQFKALDAGNRIHEGGHYLTVPHSWLPPSIFMSSVDRPFVVRNNSTTYEMTNFRFPKIPKG